MPNTPTLSADPAMNPYLLTFLLALGAIFFGGLLLWFISAQGGTAGKALMERCARVPLLDLLILYFVYGPGLLGYFIPRGQGAEFAQAGLSMLAAIGGQILGCLLWIACHEFAHRNTHKGDRIHKVMSARVGFVRNHLAVWWTLLAFPLFGLVRLAEIFLYPALIWLVKFPRYRQREWINVSRQKFDGLVGYDRLWCLYCDWMTGVWSLGGEMLRNVESFWCPIRFSSPEKCGNCKHDFPDIDGGWISAEGSLPEVTQLLQEKYSRGGPNSWFGRRVDLTVGRTDSV